MSSDLFDLVAFKQALASGHITLVSHSSCSTFCPPDPACNVCPFNSQCDRAEPIEAQYTHLITLPEWALSLDELAHLYPELFI